MTEIWGKMSTTTTKLKNGCNIIQTKFILWIKPYSTNIRSWAIFPKAKSQVHRRVMGAWREVSWKTFPQGRKARKSKKKNSSWTTVILKRWRSWTLNMWFQFQTMRDKNLKTKSTQKMMMMKKSLNPKALHQVLLLHLQPKKICHPWPEKRPQEIESTNKAACKSENYMNFSKIEAILNLLSSKGRFSCSSWLEREVMEKYTKENICLVQLQSKTTSKQENTKTNKTFWKNCKFSVDLNIPISFCTWEYV